MVNCLYATVKKYTITQLLRRTVSGQCLAWAIRGEQNSLGLQQTFFRSLENFHGYLEQLDYAEAKSDDKLKHIHGYKIKTRAHNKVAGSFDIGDVMEWLEEEALWHIQYIHYMGLEYLYTHCTLSIGYNLLYKINN